MAVYLYDEALVNKIKKWTSKTKATVLGPSDARRLFEIVADNATTAEADKLKLPIIALNRTGGFTLNQTTKQPHTYDGFRYKVENDESTNLDQISISINYRLDIYTRYLQEADEYAREFVFKLINNPTFQVKFPYNGVNKVVNANVYLSETIEDNSDIPERLITGQFSRMSIYLTVDDAYLFDIAVRDVSHVEDITLQAYKELGSNDVIEEKIQLDD